MHFSCVSSSRSNPWRLRTAWRQSALLPLGYTHAESTDHSLRLDVVDIVQDRRNPLGLRHGMNLRQGWSSPPPTSSARLLDHYRGLSEWRNRRDERKHTGRPRFSV